MLAYQQCRNGCRTKCTKANVSQASEGKLRRWQRFFPVILSQRSSPALSSFYTRYRTHVNSALMWWLRPYVVTSHSCGGIALMWWHRTHVVASHSCVCQLQRLTRTCNVGHARQRLLSVVLQRAHSSSGNNCYYDCTTCDQRKCRHSLMGVASMRGSLLTRLYARNKPDVYSHIPIALGVSSWQTAGCHACHWIHKWPWAFLLFRSGATGVCDGTCYQKDSASSPSCSQQV